MRTFTLTFVAASLIASAALAQSPSGNVGQPERAFPQAGSTTRGPIDNPSVYGAYRNADGRVDMDVKRRAAQPDRAEPRHHLGWPELLSSIPSMDARAGPRGSALFRVSVRPCDPPASGLPGGTASKSPHV
jgi:hypothetical protein